MTVLAAALVATGRETFEPGWVDVRGGQVHAVGAGAPPQPPEARAATIVPGAIDLHVHGGGGADHGGDADDIATALRWHARRGTAATLASLVSAPLAMLCRQLATIADVIEGGNHPELLGAHLEGPFLSARRCGAHDPRHLLVPDVETFAQLLAAARGTLRMITIAPELPGAPDVLDAAVAAGVLVAVGHTDATYEQAFAAFERGARVATHVFNAMPPMHHRAPGAALAALQAADGCEAIADGVHLHPAAVRLVGEHRLVLVTDAVVAAGAPAGTYLLGGQPVRAVDGAVRLVADGSLAGSTLSTAEAMRSARAAGLGWAQIVLAASVRPARLLGLPDGRGTLAAGTPADLLLLDADDRLRRVMRAGQWLAGPEQ